MCHYKRNAGGDSERRRPSATPRKMPFSNDAKPALSASDSSDTPLLPDQPARPARASLLGTDELSLHQRRIDERLRTLCLVVLALAVVAAGNHTAARTL